MNVHIRFTFIKISVNYEKNVPPSYNKYINNFDFDLEKLKDFQRFIPES